MQWALVGGLGEAGIAALCALLCIAITYMLVSIGKAIEATSIPVVSSGLASIWRTITQPVVSLLVAATDNLWSDAEWWMRNIATAFDWIWDDIKGALATDAGFISHLFNTVIPQAASHVGSVAAGYVNQEIQTLHRDISDATTAIERTASGDAARALAKAEGFAGTIKASLTKLVAHDLTVGERYADTAVAGVKSYVDSEIAKIHLPTLESIGAAPAALVGTVATVGAAVAAITTEFESCAVTSCDGPNNLSGLLKGILGFASLAEIGVFLDKVINDPAGAEAEYAGVFSGIVSPIVAGGGDVWSALEQVLGL